MLSGITKVLQVSAVVVRLRQLVAARICTVGTADRSVGDGQACWMPAMACCRTRGIPGFTGRQPPPGQSRPPLPAPDTSGWVAVNAFDERRPRVKGIPGYTGHQPPAGLRSTSSQGDN
jgi:hypothetical protein